MTDEELQIRIGQNITRIRKERGYTIQQLAELCDMEKSNLIPIEKGRVNITIGTLNKIANFLVVSVKDLI